MGICWGGLLTVNYVVKMKTVPHGLILLCPAIHRKVDLGIWSKTVAKLCLFINPEARFKIPIRDRMFTSNQRYLDFIKKDRMRLDTLTCRFFNEMLRMENELAGINHRISLPIAVMLAGHDEIVDNKKVKEWFNKLESGDKAIKVFDDMYHVMPFEENIDPLVGFITDWLEMREMSFEHQHFKN